jgi:riboflavin biosynthesis pyrimidine reductase
VGRSLAVPVDPFGRVHYGKDHISGDHIVDVVGEQVPDAYLAELSEDGASYVFAGPGGDDFAGTLAQLAIIVGAKALLLEGGGAINGAFLKQQLIDLCSTLIYQTIDGLAGAQSIVDHHGAADERPGAD